MDSFQGHEGDRPVTSRLVVGAIGLLLLAACASGGSGTQDPDPEPGTATPSAAEVAPTDLGTEPSTTGPTHQTATSQTAAVNFSNIAFTPAGNVRSLDFHEIEIGTRCGSSSTP